MWLSQRLLVLVRYVASFLAWHQVIDASISFCFCLQVLKAYQARIKEFQKDPRFKFCQVTMCATCSPHDSLVGLHVRFEGVAVNILQNDTKTSRTGFGRPVASLDSN